MLCVVSGVASLKLQGVRSAWPYLHFEKSFSILKIAKSESLSCDIVFLKYVLRHLRHEKDLSGVELETGILRYILRSFDTFGKKSEILLSIKKSIKRIMNGSPCFVFGEKSWLSFSEPLKSLEPDSLKFSGDSTGEFLTWVFCSKLLAILKSNQIFNSW